MEDIFVFNLIEKLNKIINEQYELYNSKEYICSLKLEDIVTISVACQWIQASNDRENRLNNCIDKITEKLNKSNDDMENILKKIPNFENYTGNALDYPN